MIKVIWKNLAKIAYLLASQERWLWGLFIVNYSKVRESVYFAYSLSTWATFVDWGERIFFQGHIHSFGWQVGASLSPILTFS